MHYNNHRCGHRPVALLGGATGRVGDPSGRSTERPVLSEEEIEHNVQCELRDLASVSSIDPVHESGPLDSWILYSPCSLLVMMFHTAIGLLLVNILQRNTLSLPPGAEVPDVRVVNNLDWFKGISFLSFLRDVGKFARVGTMLAKDSVRPEGYHVQYNELAYFAGAYRMGN